MFDSWPCFSMISKKVSIAAVLVFTVVGLGSASVLDSFGTVSGTVDVKPAIEIVEVDYEADSGAEYVKLYNPSHADVELDGWTIEDQDSDDEISGLTIKSEEYVLLLDDSANTTERNIPPYQQFNAIGSELDNGGDKLFLESENGHDIDSVDFTSDPCDGKVRTINRETGEEGCEDSDYNFDGDAS